MADIAQCKARLPPVNQGIKKVEMCLKLKMRILVCTCNFFIIPCDLIWSAYFACIRIVVLVLSRYVVIHFTQIVLVSIITSCFIAFVLNAKSIFMWLTCMWMFFEILMNSGCIAVEWIYWMHDTKAKWCYCKDFKKNDRSLLMRFAA